MFSLVSLPITNQIQSFFNTLQGFPWDVCAENLTSMVLQGMYFPYKEAQGVLINQFVVSYYVSVFASKHFLASFDR